MQKLKTYFLSVALLLSLKSFSQTEKLEISNKGKDSTKTYYIGLAACGGSPTGHAFVLWGESNGKDSAIIFSAYGFYPQHHTWPNHFKSVIFKVPGEIESEIGTGSLEDMREFIIIKVNDTLYKEIRVMLKEWAKKDFKLFTNDCVTFVQKAGKKTSLKIPGRNLQTFTPKKFLRKILELNPNHPSTVLACPDCYIAATFKD